MSDPHLILLSVLRGEELDREARKCVLQYDAMLRPHVRPTDLLEADPVLHGDGEAGKGEKTCR
jgi:hypothetical protein